MAGNASRENGRKGGRPPGRKNTATLEREAVSAAVRDRILQNAERIVNAQLALGEGCAFLLRRGKGAKAKAEIVTSPEQLRKFLDGDLTEDDGYYYLHTERPNNFALDSMLNRALGKATEHVELTGDQGGPVRVQFVDA